MATCLPRTYVFLWTPVTLWRGWALGLDVAPVLMYHNLSFTLGEAARWKGANGLGCWAWEGDAHLIQYNGCVASTSSFLFISNRQSTEVCLWAMKKADQLLVFLTTLQPPPQTTLPLLSRRTPPVLLSYCWDPAWNSRATFCLAWNAFSIWAEVTAQLLGIRKGKENMHWKTAAC